MKTQAREIITGGSAGDKVFAGNTNSQFYMWESQNPHDAHEFEQDLIASTNERMYNDNIEMRKRLIFNDKINFEDEIGTRYDLNESFVSDLELDLDFDDIPMDRNMSISQRD